MIRFQFLMQSRLPFDPEKLTRSERRSTWSGVGSSWLPYLHNKMQGWPLQPSRSNIGWREGGSHFLSCDPSINKLAEYGVQSNLDTEVFSRSRTKGLVNLP